MIFCSNEGRVEMKREYPVEKMPAVIIIRETIIIREPERRSEKEPEWFYDLDRTAAPWKYPQRDYWFCN